MVRPPSHPFRARLFKFALSGVLVSLVHFAIAAGLLANGVNLTLCNIIAFVFATVLSYYLNCIWTFRSEASRQSLFRFISVAIFSFVVLVVCSEISILFEVPPLIGILMMVIVLPLVSFLAHNFWSFAR